MSINAADGTPTAHDYRAKAAAVATLIADATPRQWAAASPCEGWTAADVLDHMVTTQRDFLAGQDFAVTGDDEQVGPAQRWSRHVTYVAGLLDDPDVAAHPYQGYFGPTTIGGTMAQFYGWDMVAHRYDLGMALDRDPMLSDAELEEIEAALPMFGEALRAPGICGPEIVVDAPASRLVEVMALIGRDARSN